MHETIADERAREGSRRGLQLWLGSAVLLGLAIAGGLWLIYARVGAATRLVIVILTAMLFVGAWLARLLYRADRRTRSFERSLRRGQETLRSVLDNLADGVAVTDADGRLTLFNPEAERLLGVGRTDTGPDSWTMTYGLFYPDMVTPFPGEELPLARAVRGETSDEVEIFVKNPRRRKGLFIRVKATPIRDTDGRLRGGVAIFRDVSESRLALSALRESEMRFKQLVQTIPQVFWIADSSQRRIEYVSPSYQTVFERPISALLSNPLDWIRVVHADDRRRVLEELRDLRADRVEIDFRIVRPDGETRQIRVSGFPVRDETDRWTRVTGIAEDVTERRAADESRRLRTFASHLQDAREQERIAIAREIHDELGQSLTGLKLELSLLTRRAGNEDDVRRRAGQLADHVDSITASVRRISESLRPDVLDKLGLHEAIRWLADRFEQRSGVRCSLALPGDTVRIDARRATALFRILQESLTNVARHARARNVRVVLEANGDELQLEVTDDGCGISNESLVRTGSFGLLGMRERARMFGGRLDIAAVSAGGTRVHVTLPVSLARSV